MMWTFKNNYLTKKCACIVKHLIPACGRQKLLDSQANTFNLYAHNGTYSAEDKHMRPGRAQRGDRGVDLLSTALFVTHSNTQQAITFIYVTP